MSRAALELERQVKEMRAKADKERKSGRKGAADKEARVVDNEVEEAGNEKELTGDTGSGKTDTDLSQQEAPGGNTASEATGKAEEGKKKPAMAKSKKNGAAKAKATKPAKAAKAPKAPKGDRKPREKKLASGKIKKIEKSGSTYITLEFEEGSITLTPTGNRETNRDIAVKALNALL